MHYTVLGGMPVPNVTVNITGLPPVPAETIEEHYQQQKDLPLDNFTLPESLDLLSPDNGRRLAVVGGGNSISDHVECFMTWPGEVWAINATWHWCKQLGIDATFLAADPHEIVARWAVGVTKAIIPSRVHPTVLQVLNEAKAEIKVFDLDGDNKIAHGSSTASTAIHLGLLSGYRDITFFGCEGSYPRGATHAYMHEDRSEECIIRANGEDFYTAPDYLIQSVELAAIFRASKRGLHEQSGGLLRALIKDPKYQWVWMSDGLVKIIAPADPDAKKNKEQAEQLIAEKAAA